ncbi:MspA OS=Tsukamurella paurometabola (strain ATCC 8368 / DSM / CCUG 35730 / CIP 100753 / JCM 10117/ KCTC 9821 / NBRC 16120 / NCIMB 702349 / NCTC 13040) OX=521096 GN=Tpau_0299 PE=4 SV=1 [Tsukamurella paurometabola]|uniref:MspA n=1 Tax=Tsukamurella paurometabola (strain ATCC 8368 / DSM 20162 / CCUG 35730 / CIP 100753 / JCM 10117 / KCTC 9821 / NBRC 16120 / NCIMB 702349 / NCTC 13040) TaxID=521096 RepID=D5UQW2_TSUPD|nr:MspA family porin [Tsukamurella paurometabola]ADG76945.1 hypothetical protein Tpau_0299 [Tsukamurella paurometabola DSM 20162]SUP42298.1 MspA [Tsukamurella paurometabola]
MTKKSNYRPIMVAHPLGRRSLSAAIATGILLVATPLQVQASPVSPSNERAGAVQERMVTKTTPTGVVMKVGLRSPRVESYPPLDSSPFSREAFLSMRGSAILTGQKDAIKSSRTKLDMGYQIGYPMSVAKDGAKIGIVTPNLTVNAGVKPEAGVGANAGVTPKFGVNGSATGGGGTSGGNGSGTVGGNVGADVPLGVNASSKVGAELGVKSDIIPSQKIDFTIGHGEIKEISVAKFELKQDDAILDVDGTEISVTAMAGRVSIRPYVRASIETAKGISTTVVYGAVAYL